MKKQEDSLVYHYIIYIINIFTLLAFVHSPAQAGEKGLHLSAGVMGLTNSTSQGGNGPSGSTILTQSELVYHGKWWGIGTYFQYDRQGANQTDIAFGPKLELHWGPFFLSGGYGALTQRTFTDRTIAKQTGYSWLVGAGTRFSLGGSSGRSGGRGRGGESSGGWFFQFTYNYRIQNITTQDSSPISSPIIQTDGYPLFGIGRIF